MFLVVQIECKSGMYGKYWKWIFKKMRDEEQVKKVEKEYFELCDEFAEM